MRRICYSVFLTMLGLSFSQCRLFEEELSPARSLEGTWESKLDVNFYMKSDGCGSFVRYNKTPVSISWEITELSDNEVDIWISSKKIGSTTSIGSNCGLPATLIFPLHYTGQISSSNLKLYKSQMQYSSSGAALGLADVLAGEFNFTSDILTGTLFEKSCPIYCEGYDTDSNQCVVIKI